MRYLGYTMQFALLLCGCTVEKADETVSPSREAEKRPYAGKVEVVRNGNVVACRNYAYGPEDVPLARDRSSFTVAPKGKPVAVLTVHWPTYGREEPLKESIEISTKIGPARLEVSVSTQTTSDYHLTKNALRYSLLERGSDEAEHFGYLAENDDDAIGIALNYVSRFVVPLAIGEYLYQAGRSQQEKLDRPYE